MSRTLHERMVKAVAFYGGASDEAAMKGHYLGAQLLVQCVPEGGGQQVRAPSIALPCEHQYMRSLRCALSSSEDEGLVASQTAPNRAWELTAYSDRCAPASASSSGLAFGMRSTDVERRSARNSGPGK